MRWKQASALLLTAHGLAWPQMPTLAVGATTAASWQESGVQPQVPQDARSEGLLALPALNAVRGKRILILRGDGGREFLAEQLRGRGALVDYCECYLASLVPLDGAALCTQWRTAGVDSVIIDSGEILRRFWNWFQPPRAAGFIDYRLLCPARVATSGEKAGSLSPTWPQGATMPPWSALGKRNMA
jgi:uroporphyrinogen-III synthase